MASIKTWKLSPQAEEAIETFFDNVDEKAIRDFVEAIARSMDKPAPPVADGRVIMRVAATSDINPDAQKAAHELMKLCMVSSEFIGQLSSAFIQSHQNELTDVFGIGFYEAALAIDDRPEVRELLNSLPAEKTMTLEARQEVGIKLLSELHTPAKIALGLD